MSQFEVTLGSVCPSHFWVTFNSFCLSGYLGAHPLYKYKLTGVRVEDDLDAPLVSEIALPKFACKFAVQVPVRNALVTPAPHIQGKTMNKNLDKT